MLPSIENIPYQCFNSCSALSSVEFDVGFSGSTFQVRAFENCSALQWICIPASVTLLELSCFSYSGLRAVEFAPGSKLRSIAGFCFSPCPALESFHVVSTVDSLGYNCFGNNPALREVSFAPGSQLRVFGPCLFVECVNLAQICVPSSVESIRNCVFDRCPSVRSLTFELPSALREILSFPNGCVEPVDVPDSVVRFVAPIALNQEDRALIRFGRDSQLQECALRRSAWQRNCFNRIFAGFSEGYLKTARGDLE
jgi:hypothetical protein